MKEEEGRGGEFSFFRLSSWREKNILAFVGRKEGGVTAAISALWMVERREGTMSNLLQAAVTNGAGGFDRSALLKDCS